MALGAVKGKEETAQKPYFTKSISQVY